MELIPASQDRKRENFQHAAHCIVNSSSNSHSVLCDLCKSNSVSAIACYLCELGQVTSSHCVCCSLECIFLEVTENYSGSEKKERELFISRHLGKTD